MIGINISVYGPANTDAISITTAAIITMAIINPLLPSCFSFEVLVREGRVTLDGGGEDGI